MEIARESAKMIMNAGGRMRTASRKQTIKMNGSYVDRIRYEARSTLSLNSSIILGRENRYINTFRLERFLLKCNSFLVRRFCNLCK